MTQNTMFEVKVSNSARNDTQNVAGKYGTGTGSSFAPADCSSGLLCVKNGLLPLEGYESFEGTSGVPVYKNGNSWYFNAATAGTSGGMYGDHTGIYACNNYDVNKVGSGSLQYNLGANTLGIGLPAGNRGDFTEIIIGEQYKFGVGNFSTAPTSAATIYATISNGLLVASQTAPTGGTGVYFEILRSEPVNVGSTYLYDGYIVVAKRTAEAAA